MRGPAPRHQLKPPDTNTMRIITILPESVRSFEASWPCANLERVDRIVIAECEGSIVDFDVCDHGGCSIGTPEGASEAISVLISDAIKGASQGPVREDGSLVLEDWRF